MNERSPLLKNFVVLILLVILSAILMVANQKPHMGLKAVTGSGQLRRYPAPNVVSIEQSYLAPEFLPVTSRYPEPSRITITHWPSPQPPPPSPTPQITKDGWYLYIDRGVGYSFSYPRDAHFDSGCSEIHPFCAITLQFRIPNGLGYHGIVISVEENIRRLTTEEYVRTLYPSGTTVQENYLSTGVRISVAGMSALQVEVPPTLTDFVVIFPYHEKMFVIYPTDNPIIEDDPVKAEHMALFYKVLGTFRFADNGGFP
jgi:hypothetical protein